MKHITRKFRIFSLIIAAAILGQGMMPDIIYPQQASYMSLRPLAFDEKSQGAKLGDEAFKPVHYEEYLGVMLRVLRNRVRAIDGRIDPYKPPEFFRGVATKGSAEEAERCVAQLKGRDVRGFIETLKGLPRGTLTPTPSQRFAVQVAADILKNHPECLFDAENVLFISPVSWIAALFNFSERTVAQYHAIYDGKDTAHMILICSDIQEPLAVLRIALHESLHASLNQSLLAVNSRIRTAHEALSKQYPGAARQYLWRNWEMLIVYMLNEGMVEELVTQIMREACLHPALQAEVERERASLSKNLGKICTMEEAIEKISAPDHYSPEHWLARRLCFKQDTALAVKTLLATGDFGLFRRVFGEEKCDVLAVFEEYTQVLAQIYRRGNHSGDYYQTGLLILGDLLMSEKIEDTRNMADAAMAVLEAFNEEEGMLDGISSHELIKSVNEGRILSDKIGEIKKIFRDERGYFSHIIPFTTTRASAYKVEAGYRLFKDVMQGTRSVYRHRYAPRDRYDSAIAGLLATAASKARELLADLTDRAQSMAVLEYLRPWRAPYESI